jgi:pSer/pThr/pTyr-binding forkhead associated (FHA) protein
MVANLADNGVPVGVSMPAQLVALNEGFRILLDKPILLVGRDSECDIQLESRKVSRRHCCIAQVGDYLVVRDLGSTNGIRINGIRVMEGTLKAGDELTIGNHSYQVRWDGLASVKDQRERAKDRVKKDTPRPLPGRAVDDDALESCDEPIALQDSPEDANKNIPAAARPEQEPDRQLPHPAPQEGKAKSGAPSDPGAPIPLVLPDNILPDKVDLAPLSEQFPSISPRSPRN